MAGALLSYAALTGSQRHRDAATAALGVLGPLAARFPRAAGWGLAVAEAMVSGPAEIAIVGPPGDPGTAELQLTALQAAPPGAVIALGDGSAALSGPADEALPGLANGALGSADGTTGGPADGVRGGVVPLLAGRGLVDGAPAAYVCRNFTCQLPVTDPAALRAALGDRPPWPS